MTYPSFFTSQNKEHCNGCEACSQACPSHAIEFYIDKEGFRYPRIKNSLCVSCGLCFSVCPIEHDIFYFDEKKEVFGGYLLDEKERFESTSGGAFTAICKSFFNEDTIIFGATAKGLEVYHTEINNLDNLYMLRKSKYSQSRIGDCYKRVKTYLKDGKKVLFSGTPCQISGLRLFLNNIKTENLLTVEVVCEGIPSPLYVDKYVNSVQKRFNKTVVSFDYRSKESKRFRKRSKWDFEVEKITFSDGSFLLKDRWFNPFWQIWINHLMSRPSCYVCKFARTDRVADITLGDLWGVHVYCPELYGHNGGSSLVVCNTEKGKKVFEQAKKKMFGHQLLFEEALKYQGPLKRHISFNNQRNGFMEDLTSNLSYQDLIKKWYKKPSLYLLWRKYIWGNRQKVFFYNLFHKTKVK